MEDLETRDTLTRLEFLTKRVEDNQDRLIAASEDDVADDLTADIGSDLEEMHRLKELLARKRRPHA